jgi:hypothetical protein
VHLASLLRRSGALVGVAALSTLVIAGITLGGVLLFVR